MSKARATMMYKKLVAALESHYGNETKTNTDLINIGRAVFAPLGNNVFRNADYDFNRMEDTYSIINNDNGVGEHWLAVYQERHSVYVFDTFGRDIKKLMPEFHARGKAQGYSIVNANKHYDNEQEANQSDCGLRSLAWLILAKSKGIKTATLV
jgi:hypothetical protein